MLRAICEESAIARNKRLSKRYLGSLDCITEQILLPCPTGALLFRVRFALSKAPRRSNSHVSLLDDIMGRTCTFFLLKGEASVTICAQLLT